MVGAHIDIGTRVQALTLLEIGMPVSEIIKITKVSKPSIHRLRKTALERRYAPEVCKVILAAYVEDAPKSGRPVKAIEAVEELVISTVSKNSTTCKLSCQRIADSIAPTALISARTVHRILKRRGYRALKPTYKPGLTAENKLARLKWCLDHKDWTLEDWKNVIWSDETSVTMGGQRGRRRIWRLQSEAYLNHCIRRRWKGFKQFMFWGYFLYDLKGPCYI